MHKALSIFKRSLVAVIVIGVMAGTAAPAEAGFGSSPGGPREQEMEFGRSRR